MVTMVTSKRKGSCKATVKVQHYVKQGKHFMERKAD